MQRSFEDLAEMLGPEAVDLLMELGGLHVAATGDRMFIEADDVLIFTGTGPWTGQPNINFDAGALLDLVDHTLIHVEIKGGRGYRLKSGAVRFYRWLLAKSGAPVDELDSQLYRFVDGAAFAQAHGGAAHHLREAFDLLWSERDDPQTVSEIGDHLRKAIMDLAADLAGADGGNAEVPIPRLRGVVARAELHGRERLALERLIDLAEAVLRLDHRANHVRDEVDSGEPAPSPDELRRAAFLTAYVCYELDRLP